MPHKLPAKAQHMRVSTLQKRWAADAARDYHYNLNRSHQERAAGNIVLARGYATEAKWDLQWQNRRIRLANRERGLGMK